MWPRSNLSLGDEFDFEIIGVVETIPALVPTVAFECQAQVRDAGGSGFRPEHPGLFEALAVNRNLAKGIFFMISAGVRQWEFQGTPVVPPP